MNFKRLCGIAFSVILAVPLLSAISIESASAAACSPNTITANNFTYKYFKTATTCDWTIPSGVSKADVLIVGGGGSGGIGGSLANEAGGGGAGGFIENLGVAVTPNSIASIVVGAGAPGATTASNGSDSSAFGYTAKGGGAGATNGGTGANGGSGGGGSHNTTAGGTATPSGQGNSGASGGGSIGGGGGGAGSAGSSFNGGFGKQSVITSLYYAGGGAAIRTAGSILAGAAYHGGGVPVSTSNNAKTSAQDGVANTGSGGAGGFSGNLTANNGAGGSGIVVIRYYTAVETLSAVDTVTVGTRNAFVPLTTTTTAIDAAGFTGTVSAAIRTTNAFFKIGTSASSAVTALTGYTDAQRTSGTDTETAFSGTLAQINALLDTISVSVTNSNAKIQFALFPSGYSYSFDTGHLYKGITYGSGVYWEFARCASLFDTSTITNSTTGATDCTYSGTAPTQNSVLGLSGYLVNITSTPETSFLIAKSALTTGTIWAGGSDATTVPAYSTEGNFLWTDGPESRKLLRDSGCATGTIGTCPNAAAGYNYANWGTSEPNNSGGTENYIDIGTDGLWNDCANSCNLSKFLIEFGNTGETLYTADSIDLTIAGQPPVLSLPGNSMTANKLIQTTLTATVASPGSVTFYYKGQVIGKCKNKVVTGTAPNLSYGCAWKPVIQGQQVITVKYIPDDSSFLSPMSTNLTIMVGKRTGAR